MKKCRYLALCFFVLATVNCASSSQSNLEDARFALNDSDFDSAITNASEAIADDPDLIEAYHILGSAHFGNSGLDFLDIAATLLDLDTSTSDAFRVIGDALPDDADLTDLRSAIEALETTPGITDATIDDTTDDGHELASTAFDLGIMMAVEHYALGVYDSAYKTGTVDVSLITDDDAARVQADLIDFDNYLVASGMESDHSFIQAVRQTYCILEAVSAAEGFTTAEYRTLVGCELDDSFDATTTGAGIANCAALADENQSDAVHACYEEDTTL